MRLGRSSGAALLAAVLVVGTNGCVSVKDDASSDGETSAGSSTGAVPAQSAEPVDEQSMAQAADDAATAYVAALRSYHQQLVQASATSTRGIRGESGPIWAKAQRQFTRALAAAPTLEDVDGGAEASAAYARAVEVAEHAQGFIDEHEWMTGWDTAANIRLNSDLYVLENDQYAHSQDLASDYSDTMAGPGNLGAKAQRALRAQISGQLDFAAKARREIEGIGGDDSFTPSMRDHFLYELDDKVSVGERYLEYVETMPEAGIDRRLFMNGFSGATIPLSSVTNAPALRIVPTRRLLAMGIGQLVDAADSQQGELPRAGDIYRQIITSLFYPHRRPDKDERKFAVAEQLYWLWHIREIEDTPEDAFQDARLTIKLQHQGPLDNPFVTVDSRFDELMGITNVLTVSTANNAFLANKPWLIEMLGRPFPPLLDKAVNAARQAAQLLPEDASTRPSRKQIDFSREAFVSLRSNAKELDSTKRFGRAFRAAIAGTRPSDG